MDSERNLQLPLENAASVRFFTAYQSRESNGTGIVDYDNLDIGWGANFSLRF